jgi:hypothetical protein
MSSATHPTEQLQDILNQAQRNTNLSLDDYVTLQKLLSQAIALIKRVNWLDVSPPLSTSPLCFGPVVLPTDDECEPMDWM